jgi:hypothetical protein
MLVRGDLARYVRLHLVLGHRGAWFQHNECLWHFACDTHIKTGRLCESLCLTALLVEHADDSAVLNVRVRLHEILELGWRHLES